MNNDLISRSGLGVDYCNPDVFANKAYAEGWNSLIKIIKEAPAVDAEPVRHGVWIRCNGKSSLWYCSECGEKIIYNPTRKTYKPEKLPVYEVNKRCRNCGAKMDGDADAPKS